MRCVAVGWQLAGQVGDVASAADRGGGGGGARRRRRVGTAAVLRRASQTDERHAGAARNATERADDVVTGGRHHVAAGRTANVDHPRRAELRARVGRVAAPQTLHAPAVRRVTNRLTVGI